MHENPQCHLISISVCLLLLPIYSKDNYSADVYSFGIMLWEIVSMEIPFKFFNQTMIKEMVVNFGNRPEIDESWPVEVQTLIKTCWSVSWRKRPNFAEIIRVLDSEIAKVQAQ